MEKTNKTIPADVLEALAERAVYKEAEQDNIELGYALKQISDVELREIIGANKPRVISVKRLFRERLAWAVSVAAVVVIAITISLHFRQSAMNEKCDLIYAYNSQDLASLIARAQRSGQTEIDITSLSTGQLKDALPRLFEDFDNAETLQDTAIAGKVLTLAYIRLHKTDDAKKVLAIMRERLSEEPEDYRETIKWCGKLISQLE